MEGAKTVDGMEVGFWRDRPVFITGATGLLGSWMVERLVGLKANVIVFVRDHVPSSLLIRDKLIERCTIVPGDLTDYHTLNRALNEYAIDTVFHLGAQTQVRIANRNPLPTLESNVRGTWNLLEACRVNQVKRIVLASSDKAYGAQEKLPYTEATPLQGRNLYDASKSCADIIAQSFYHAFNLPVTVTRCGNFYGGGDINFDRIVPGTIRSVYNNEAPVIRSDGTFVRDYIYIKDAVTAYLLLAELAEKRKLFGEAFNFSAENRMDVLALVKTILKLMNSSLEPLIMNDVNHEIKNQYLDSTKAYRVLGWQPKYGIEDGLKETIEWYVDHFKRRVHD